LYIRELGRVVAAKGLDLEALAGLDDEAARARLIELKGIGPWSADIYLLMALGRPDIWPTGDLALLAALREVKNLRTAPSPERLARITRPWRPWRAVAARLLSHSYLSTRRSQTSTS
jgi:DNA-3-methyladenine glycosylase II